jgi:2-keto-4-pentenoate hydratase
MQRTIHPQELALQLMRAELECTPVPPLSETYADLTPEVAYEIQNHWLSYKLAEGRQLVGRKIGLTSRAMQQQMGVDQPDYGFLLDSMIVPSGSTLISSKFIQPRIEPEIAFWLIEDLHGPQITIKDVLAATRGVSAALELVDSRIINWRIKLVDTIADNASSARVIVSADIHPLDKLDLVTEDVELLQNGEPVGTGTGAAVLGHPAAAVAWLANKLAEFGVTLRAGQLVLPGAMCASVSVGPGDLFQAKFNRLGEVWVRFAESR